MFLRSFLQVLYGCLVAYVVRIAESESHVAGVKRANDCSAHIGSIHLAIAIILNSNTKGAMLANALAVACAHEIGAAYIAHIVQPNLVVKLLAKQSRVLLHEIDIVVNY